MNNLPTPGPKLNIYQQQAQQNLSRYASQLRPGEIWVGNSNVREGVELNPRIRGKMATARLGEQAYDIFGNPIETDYMRPCFIHQSEEKLYDRLMMGNNR
jgi:hypothetical protein